MNKLANSPESIQLGNFYSVAQSVKSRSKSEVVLHLAAEVGEIAECLVQPQRKGNIVEESVDAIICALDVIYLELGTNHGESEITNEINRLVDLKLKKWLHTCGK